MTTLLDRLSLIKDNNHRLGKWGRLNALHNTTLSGLQREGSLYGLDKKT
ncbi:protein of unknown function [Xenorhabdus bovienii]|uniref:Uncharacterized protein n=1 Tax=Xenorhabdus bovienii TaxID=40576 RepID=A0A0B6XG09_XENBV|nr:protein of unknown function [Xenorhabdus bovienii]